MLKRWVRMPGTVLTLTIGLVTTAAIAAQQPKAVGQDGYTTVPLDTIKEQVAAKKAVLVDVREQREWDQGHLKSAVLLSLSQLSAWERDGLTAAEKAALEKAVPKGSVVYCHCAAGGRALPGGEALRKLGYEARPLRQGYRDLVQAGFQRAAP